MERADKVTLIRKTNVVSVNSLDKGELFMLAEFGLNPKDSYAQTVYQAKGYGKDPIDAITGNTACWGNQDIEDVVRVRIKEIIVEEI